MQGYFARLALSTLFHTLQSTLNASSAIVQSLNTFYLVYGINYSHFSIEKYSALFIE